MNNTPNKVLLSKRFSLNAGSAITLGYEQRNLVDLVAKKLTDGSYQMSSDCCPCGSPGGDKLLSEVDRYGLPLETVLCPSCGTLRANPYPVAEGLADFYTYYYQQMYARSNDRSSYFAKQQVYGRRILDSVRGWLPAGSFVFEVGCGAGGALEVLGRNGYEVGGCDYSHELVDYGIGQSLSLHWGPPLEVLKPPMPAPSLIYMHHVFEHVRDPLTELIGLRELLAPLGKLLIIVPDVSRISEFPFPAGDLRLFLHIAHRFNFSVEGIYMLARRAGFAVENLEQRSASESPELWALLVRNDISVNADEYPDAGDKMMAYLERTEQLHKLFLNRGQILGFFGRIRSTFTRAIRGLSRRLNIAPKDIS